MNIVEARRVARRVSGSRVDPTEYYGFDGGLNLVDTPMLMGKGEAISAYNYDISPRRGYRRMKGYERLDGRLKPSLAQYYLVTYTSGIPANYPPLGGTVTTVSGTAVVLQVMSGTTGTIVLGRLTGSIDNGQALQYLAVTFATASSAAAAGGASSYAQDVAYKVLAENDQRALIQKVPGAGPVLGAAIYNGVVYAFRNHTDNLSAKMWKATSAGWVAVDFGTRFNFNNGTVEPAVGAPLYNGTGTLIGVVAKVVLVSGTWSGSGTGYVILTSYSGFYGATGGGANVLYSNPDGSGFSLVTTNWDTPTLLPNGRYEFRVHNFYGHSGRRRLYGVDGKNKAFEFQDGAAPSFCQIATGMTIDAPTHLEAWLGALWLAFPGGSLQKSGVKDPITFTVVTGAAEFGVGDEITGLAVQSETTMLVFSRNRTDYMLGTQLSDLQLKPFTPDSGMVEWTFQNIVGGVFLDDKGFTNVSASQNYGNFQTATFSSKIEPLLNDIRANVAASVLVRGLNAYRMFLGDGRVISIYTRDSKIVGFMVGSYGVAISCAANGEDAGGREMVVLGGRDGYVYQAESGRNFDGNAVVAFLKLAYNHNGTPGWVKRYRRAIFEVMPEGLLSLRFAPLYTFSRTTVAADLAQVMSLPVSGSGISWDETTWNDPSGNSGVTQASMGLEGSGENISFMFSVNSALEEPHQIGGVNLHKSRRRLERGSVSR